MTQEIFVPENGGIPNHPRWPALVLPRAAEAGIDVEAAKDLIGRNGWTGLWDWTVYDYHHFHPDAHEALLCVAGRATIRLGGPEGEAVEVTPGAGLILPAGTGHRREESSDDFRVVGAYPPGQSASILHAGEAFDADALTALPAPAIHPFTGTRFDRWT